MRIFFVIIRFNNSIIHYEIDTIVLKDRTKEVDILKNNILSIKNTNKQNFKNMKSNRVRCDICKIDFHRTSYARHLKCEKHLDNMLEKMAIIPIKNPVKRTEKKI